MVVIRLARVGAKKRPFYHVVVADKRRSRNGKYIERVGFFNPLAVGGEVELELQKEKIAEWVSKGAQLSDKVQALMKQPSKATQAA